MGAGVRKEVRLVSPAIQAVIGMAAFLVYFSVGAAVTGLVERFTDIDFDGMQFFAIMFWPLLGVAWLTIWIWEKASGKKVHW